jgi:hypothetical protein
LASATLGRTERWLLALGVAFVLVAAVASYHLTLIEVPNNVRSIARTLGEHAGIAVEIGQVELGLLGAVELDRVRAGRVEVDLVRLAPTWSAIIWNGALGLEAHVENARAPALSIGRADLVVTRARVHATGRATVRDLAYQVRGVRLELRQLGIELDGTRGVRAAFAGLNAGGLADWSGTCARNSAGEIALTAARDGARVELRSPSADRLKGTVTFDRLALGSLAATLRPAWLDLASATASGQLAISGTRRAPVVAGTAQLAEVTLEHPAISAAPLSHLAPRLDGKVELDRLGTHVHKLAVALGALELTVLGEHAPPHFFVEASLKRAPCSQVLATLPFELRQHLEGMSLEGDIGGRVRVAGELGDLDNLRFDPAIEVGCNVVADATAAPVRALVRGGAEIKVLDARGQPRTLRLERGHGAFTSLDQIPAAVVRAFVGSEDGRFFLHHGFDPERIRHALATDLNEGRVMKGASTISQQVAKNLYLSGERTLGRKLEEAVLTWRLEQALAKRRILELYMNLVELGPGIYGVGEAAHAYFNKPLKRLTEDEGAKLAALLPAPRRQMDEAWQRRYEALSARLPREKIVMEAPRPTKATQRSQHAALDR